MITYIKDRITHQTENYDYERKRNIVVMYLILLVMCPFAIMWASFYELYDDMYMSIFHWIAAGIYLILSLLTFYSSASYRLCRFLLISVSTTYLIGASLLLGLLTGTELYMALFPFAFSHLFSRKEKTEFIRFLIIVAVLYISAVVWLYNNDSILKVNAYLLEKVSITILFNLVFVSMLFSYIFWSQNSDLFEIIIKEKNNSERLLLNILPEAIAQKLKSGQKFIVDDYKDVTIIFADIVKFTQITQSMSPRNLVALLDEIFTVMDDLADKHGLEKIKTIGDEYMAVCGLPTPDARHCEKMADMALELMNIVKERYVDKHNLQLRIGIHTGKVVAGIIGKRKFSFDLWGETVNIASRYESHGRPGMIHISEKVKNLLSDKYLIESGKDFILNGNQAFKSFFLLNRT